MSNERSLAAEVMEGVGLITINAPSTNAATKATWSALRHALERCAEDAAVRVVVITGAGHMAFVTDPVAAEMEAQASYDEAARHGLAALAAFAKPSNARVRGDCAGAGTLLALYCDMVVAARDSAFSVPGARWGAAYTGDRLEAEEGLRLSLVTLVTANADLSNTVVQLAQAIGDNAPLALRAAKRMVANLNEPALHDGVEQCRRSQDYADAIAALRQSRPVRFRGCGANAGAA